MIGTRVCAGGMGVAISGEYIEERSLGYGFDNETMCSTGTHTADVDEILARKMVASPTFK